MDEILAKAEKLRDTLEEAKSFADDLASLKIKLEFMTKNIKQITKAHKK